MDTDTTDGRSGRIRPDNYEPSPYLQRPGQQGIGALAVAADGSPDQNPPNPSNPLLSGLAGSQSGSPQGPPELSGSGASGDPIGPTGSATNGKKPGRLVALAAALSRLSRKQKLLIGGAILILVAGSASALALSHKDKPAVTTVKPAAKKAVPPAPPVSPLTGLPVSGEDIKRPVIGVMIENSIFARPQSGLDQAGVVYEAIAEAGITRFLALYQEANPGNIGPIRSSRPYYVDWTHGYDAGYAHVGGSPDALAKIKADGIRDLDQFANSGSYHRISQRDAPHNVYTGMQQLRDLMAAKGWTGSSFTGLPRKKETPAADGKITAQKVDISISGPTYSVHYDYDKASNTYLRVMAGAPHKDAETGKQLAPKVVIGLATQYGLMSDGYHSTYTVAGSGAAKIFQDGTETDATWKRDQPAGQYSFTTADGKPVSFDPGQVWLTVVGDPGAISFAGQPAPAAAP